MEEKKSGVKQFTLDKSQDALVESDVSMKLKDYLEAEGIRQAQFAEMIGVSQQAVSLYCKGGMPSRQVAARIVEATGGKVRLEDLWGSNFKAA